MSRRLRNRLLTCVWLAPIRKGYLHAGDSSFRPILYPERWERNGRAHAGNADFKLALHVFPESIRLSYFWAGLIWYGFFGFLAPILKDSSHEAFAHTLGWLPWLHVSTSETLTASVIGALLWILLGASIRLGSRWRSPAPVAITSAAVVVVLYCVDRHFNVWAWLWPDVSNLVAHVGFLSIAVILPTLYYALFRRPIWDRIEEKIPPYVISYVRHTPFEKIFVCGVRGELVTVWRCFKAFCGATDYSKEPVYWRNLPSIQEQVIEASALLYFVQALKRKSGLWLLHGVLFLFGAAILAYLGLWVLAVLELYERRILGMIGFVWAVLSVAHLMGVINVAVRRDPGASRPLVNPIPTWASDYRRALHEELQDLIGTRERFLLLAATLNIVLSIMFFGYLVYL